MSFSSNIDVYINVSQPTTNRHDFMSLPGITTGPKTEVLKIGDSITMFCNTTNSTSEALWQKDGRTLDTSKLGLDVSKHVKYTPYKRTHFRLQMHK